MLAPAAKALTLLKATVMLTKASPGRMGMVLDRCIAPPPKPAVLFRNATLDIDRFEFTPAGHSDSVGALHDCACACKIQCTGAVMCSKTSKRLLTSESAAHAANRNAAIQREAGVGD